MACLYIQAHALTGMGRVVSVAFCAELGCLPVPLWWLGMACLLFSYCLLRSALSPTSDYKWAFIVFVVYTLVLVGWYATFFVFKDGPLKQLSVLRPSKTNEFLEDVA